MIKRNNSLDFFKGIACIAVVFMHVEFPGIIGTMVQSVARWSVPLFFATSGYFMKNGTVESCFRKSKHILQIILYATLFYVAFGIGYHAYLGDLAEYTASQFSVINVFSFILFNVPVFINGHLWFLFALLYVYLSYAIMIRLDLVKYQKVLCILLLCGHFAMSYGAMLFLEGGAPGRLYRNFVFEGLPFFILGNLMYHINQNIETDSQKGRIHKLGLVLFLVSIILSMAERILVGQDFSVHIASVIALIGILMFVSVETIPAQLNIFAELGRNHSLMIYILHPAIYRVIDICAKGIKIGDTDIYLWIRPVLALIFTIIVAILFEKIKGAVLKYKKGA